MGHVGGVNVKCITEIDIALGGNKYMISFIHCIHNSDYFEEHTNILVSISMLQSVGWYCTKYYLKGKGLRVNY